jgi:hypothetical protein
MQGASVLAELELLGVLPTKGITEEPLAAILAQIVAARTRSRLDFDRLVRLFHLAQQFADCFHVILIEVGLSQLGGVVRSEDLDFHNVMIFAGA